MACKKKKKKRTNTVKNVELNLRWCQHQQFIINSRKTFPFMFQQFSSDNYLKRKKKNQKHFFESLFYVTHKFDKFKFDFKKKKRKLKKKNYFYKKNFKKIISL